MDGRRLFTPVPVPALQPLSAFNTTTVHLADAVVKKWPPFGFPICQLAFLNRIAKFGVDGCVGGDIQQRNRRDAKGHSSISSAFSLVVSFSNSSFSPRSALLSTIW